MPPALQPFLQKAAGWGSFILPLALLGIGLWLVLRNIDRLPLLSAERVTGVLLLLVTPDQIRAAVAAVTRGELAEDPIDLVANLLVRYANELNVSTTQFGAFYLLVHGLVKVLLAGAVLRDKIWAYPWLIAFLVAFIGWQTYELVAHFTVGLLLLTLFDLFIVYLTVREYARHRALRTGRPPADAT